MSNVEFSTNFSILVQIITGIISFQGIFLKLPKKHIVLNEILTVETLVQGVELFFYIYFLKSMASTNLQDMGSIRYFDWAITTPTMLLTTVIYFKYQEYIQKNIKKPLRFWDFVKENKQNIIIIFVSNLLMLLYGYFGEKNIIDMTSSILGGFIFFAITFNTIYKNYALNTSSSMKIFYFILGIWGLYGVAALLNPYDKNNAFNILDIFAKNFFGLYLYYTAKNISLTNTENFINLPKTHIINPNCICLICFKPNDIWIEFLSKFTKYDIFIIVLVDVELFSWAMRNLK